MKNILIERIRQRRFQLGYSQEYMAKKLGISQQAYSKIEQQPMVTTVWRLLEIAKILDIPLHALCDFNSSEEIAVFEEHQSNKEVFNSIKRLFKELGKKLDSMD